MWMIKNHEALLKMNEIENVALGFYLLFKAFNRVSCSNLVIMEQLMWQRGILLCMKFAFLIPRLKFAILYPEIHYL